MSVKGLGLLEVIVYLIDNHGLIKCCGNAVFA